MSQVKEITVTIWVFLAWRRGDVGNFKLSNTHYFFSYEFNLLILILLLPELYI